MEIEPCQDHDTPCPCKVHLGPYYALWLTHSQVMDVAQALANFVHSPQLARTISLPGPSALTYEYLLDLVSSLTYQPPSRAPAVPKAVALAIAKAAQSVWWPLLSPDEVVRRYIDDADTPGAWDAVGVTPTEIEQHAIQYLRRYRSAENFSRPNVFPTRKSVSYTATVSVWNTAN